MWRKKLKYGHKSNLDLRINDHNMSLIDQKGKKKMCKTYIQDF